VSTTRAKITPTHFKTIKRLDVPEGRNGKHKLIVSTILQDLDRLTEGAALQVPLAELSDSKEKVRSALNRASHKMGRRIVTASDATFLYVWNAKL
jgi:hypothetical protein